MRKIGYVEGKHFVFEYRSAENKDGFPTWQRNSSVSRLMCRSPRRPGGLAAKSATSTIPILFTLVADPVSAGLIDSLARPGGNVTGLTSIAGVLAGKRLELLKETLPRLTSVAILWNPQDTGAQTIMEGKPAGRPRAWVCNFIPWK